MGYGPLFRTCTTASQSQAFTKYIKNVANRPFLFNDETEVLPIGFLFLKGYHSKTDSNSIDIKSKPSESVCHAVLN